MAIGRMAFTLIAKCSINPGELWMPDYIDGHAEALEICIGSHRLVRMPDRRQCVDRRGGSRGGRRNTDLMMEVVRSEYRTFPHLYLTIPQACRLWHLSTPTCKDLLNLLVRQGFLSVTPAGEYVALRESGKTPCADEAAGPVRRAQALHADDPARAWRVDELIAPDRHPHM